MPDDIAYWKNEIAKLQQVLAELESDVEKASQEHLIYLKTRIADVDRHIAALEKRRT